MVIAFGSYPKGHRFESHHRHHLLWPHGQAVKTSPFHGGIRSSILLGVTIIKNYLNYLSVSRLKLEKIGIFKSKYFVNKLILILKLFAKVMEA